MICREAIRAGHFVTGHLLDNSPYLVLREQAFQVIKLLHRNTQRLKIKASRALKVCAHDPVEVLIESRRFFFLIH
jgi:hypothetical protein